MPAIKISHIVPGEVAVNIRNPSEKPPSSKWNLASALDDDSDFDDDLHDLDTLVENQPLHFRPKSVSCIPALPKQQIMFLNCPQPTEMMLLALLCSLSCLVVVYTIVVSYRCICSRFIKKAVLTI